MGDGAFAGRRRWRRLAADAHAGDVRRDVRHLLLPHDPAPAEAKAGARADAVRDQAGDKVVTTSGMFGTVTNLTDKTITLRVADQVKLEFERGAIGRVVEVQVDKDA